MPLNSWGTQASRPNHASSYLPRVVQQRAWHVLTSRQISRLDTSRHIQVLAVLKSIAAEAMGAEVAPDVPLMSAGLDSLGAVELRNGISAKFGISMPATIAFDYPTLQVRFYMQSLAAHLQTEY